MLLLVGLNLGLHMIVTVSYISVVEIVPDSTTFTDAFMIIWNKA